MTFNLRTHARTLIAALAPVAVLCSAAAAQPQYQQYIGGYPQAETNWSDDTQGIAHDDNNWFITQTEVLWKIPVARDLRTVTSTSTGVIRRSLSFYPSLSAFHHTGDPVVYRLPNGADILLVPLEGSGQPATIALFDCATLAYITRFTLASQAGDAGWCAVDADGIIYSSLQHASSLTAYFVDWPHFVSTGVILITPLTTQGMYNESNQPLDLVTMQGGEFGPGGLLYLSSGFYSDSNSLADREGIHIMRKLVGSQGTIQWDRIAHSTRGTGGHFDYYYNPGTVTGAEEPEGLTIWDLDDGRAPGIRGQLHATVLTNQLDAGNIDFKHYSYIINVNAAGTCQSGLVRGAPTCPHTTVTAAVANAWDGSEIDIQAGAYSGPLTVSTRTTLRAIGGTVRIGH